MYHFAIAKLSGEPGVRVTDPLPEALATIAITAIAPVAEWAYVISADTEAEAVEVAQAFARAGAPAVWH